MTDKELLKLQRNTPTYNQMWTMKRLMDLEWELVIGKYLVLPLDHPGYNPKRNGTERIYWKYYNPLFANSFIPYEIIDCGSAKMERYRMSIMERYGWIKKTKKSWKILKAGRDAVARYDEWWAEVEKKYFANSSCTS